MNNALIDHTPSIWLSVVMAAGWILISRGIFQWIAHLFKYKVPKRHDEWQRDFVDAMRQNKIDGWQGPPGALVYFVLRSDAVDVVYGTMEGYQQLGVPYMAHIAPEKRW